MDQKGHDNRSRQMNPKDDKYGGHQKVGATLGIYPTDANFHSFSQKAVQDRY